ncbi:MAG: hypothetical protein A2Z03_06060 [Chloroflexi bacterium RBG_16_56_8]|nr:MAG: hypothetical protein A2Z03_06060 [Chloroflexi bacterium RBG_16_56_8]
MENTAVLTFFKNPRRFSDLAFVERRELLKVSYNNLVDWHIQIQADEVLTVFNRTDPPTIVQSDRISRDSFDALRSESFERVSGKRPNPNLPALDDALIETISYWKKNLSAELGYTVPNESLSTLFNSIIFIRAVEDNSQRRQAGGYTELPHYSNLLGTWNEHDNVIMSLRELLVRSLEVLTQGGPPAYLVNETLLRDFDGLNREVVSALLSDFYRNKYAPPYEYDFSLISKHALSRIYEHYVSILRVQESPQLTLFPRLPEEERNRAFGSVYTPQFIARFFGRYLREQMPPLAFKRIRAIDPACGSGIFPRTLLELQCDPVQDGVTTDLIHTAFGNVVGLDIDENACQATRLSLALLHLVLTNELPEKLNVISAESIEYFQQHSNELKGKFDAVMVNPPFVPLETQSITMRERISQFMGKYASGRIDMYLAFLRIGLELLKPEGYGLFVLPHSFLLAKNAAKMRDLIREMAWIRCLVDLSAIRVFEDSDSYVILLIFQKKVNGTQKSPSATIVKCQESAGHALQDAIEGKRIETSFYSIYDVDQDVFGENEWLVVPPTESALSQKLKTLASLDEFLEVREGFISGADDVYIISKEQIPQGEGAIYVPFLPDRLMTLYKVPTTTPYYVFYPYIGEEKVDETTLKAGFPQTWKYLRSHRKRLEQRKSLVRYDRAWWEPMWPRPPENMMRPKIISPHLILMPRFSLDRTGKFAISRAPLFYPKEVGAEDDLLRFFIAVLNSTVFHWYTTTHSHVYRGGYLMLEPKTIRKTPVPDPSKISPKTMRKFLELVDSRLSATGANATELETRLNLLVADLYGVDSRERRALGMEE